MSTVHLVFGPQGAAAAARPASVSHPFFWAPFVLSGDWR